jgi:hypothetical protein
MSMRLAGDLVVLVADKDMEQAVLGLLERADSLRIQPPARASIFVHVGRDSGCRMHCHEFLRSFQNQYRFALVLFDLEGSGRDHQSRATLEESIEQKLAQNGWKGRSAAIAFDPELEIWVWSDSPEVDQVLGWAGREPGLREWIQKAGFALDSVGKPVRPKEAFTAALRESRKQPSAALFGALARRVSLSRCTDPALQKFAGVLREWFPQK